MTTPPTSPSPSPSSIRFVRINHPLQKTDPPLAGRFGLMRFWVSGMFAYSHLVRFWRAVFVHAPALCLLSSGFVCICCSVNSSPVCIFCRMFVLFWPSLWAFSGDYRSVLPRFLFYEPLTPIDKRLEDSRFKIYPQSGANGTAAVAHTVVAEGAVGTHARSAVLIATGGT